MRKRLAILAIVTVIALNVAGQPNKATRQEQQPAKQVQPSIHLASSNNEEPHSQTDQSKPGSNAPAGNTSVERSHWWISSDWPLTIIAFATGFIICWQSWETRKAAEAANRGIAISKTKERAKLLLSPQPLNPVVGAIPEAKLFVTNVGESNAQVGQAIAGLHISDPDTPLGENSRYYDMKIGYRLLESKEFSEEVVYWPTHGMERYSQDVIDDKVVVHLHGIIRFKDAFDDSWQVNFHFIWRHYEIAIWFPHLQAHKYGEWEDQDEKGEYPLPKLVKHRWWKFWSKAIPSDKNAGFPTSRF